MQEAKKKAKKKYPCVQCGLCCSAIGKAKDQTLIKKAGLTYREDGSCTNLVDNKCTIYMDRPSICVISHSENNMYDPKKYEDPALSYYMATAYICNSMMDATNSEYPRVSLLDILRDYKDYP